MRSSCDDSTSQAHSGVNKGAKGTVWLVESVATSLPVGGAIRGCTVWVGWVGWLFL